MRSTMKLCQLLLLLIPTSASFSLASNKQSKAYNHDVDLLLSAPRGGSQVLERAPATAGSTELYSVNAESSVSVYKHSDQVSPPQVVVVAVASESNLRRNLWGPESAQFSLTECVFSFIVFHLVVPFTLFPVLPPK